MTHETKITPQLAQVLTDEHESGATLRELERKHGVSRSRIGVHVQRERERRAVERQAIAADRRERADHVRRVREGAERAQPARVQRQRAGNLIRDGLAGVLDANDAASDARAQRIRERGLHPLRATVFQLSASDAEWAAYLAGRDTWPPGVNPDAMTRMWKLGTATETVTA
jgi:DNA-binding MarR family transcriptional regulator